MSQLKKLPAPKRWTPAARGWIIKCGGVAKTAALIGAAPCTLSQWHNGNARPTADRVKQIITLALGSGVCLTPADLGRPDLMPKDGAKVRPAVGTDEWCELPDVREAVAAISTVMAQALRDEGIRVDAPIWRPVEPRLVNLREQIPADLQAQIDYARNTWMAGKV